MVLYSFILEEHLSIALIKQREEWGNIRSTQAFLPEPLMSVQEVIELQRDV